MYLNKGKLLGVIVTILTIITSGTLIGYELDNTKIEFIICVIGILIAVTTFPSLLNKIKKMTIFVLLIVLTTIVQLLLYPEMIGQWFRLVLLIFIYLGLINYFILRQVDIFYIYYYTFLVFMIISFIIYCMVNVFNINLPYYIYSNGWLPDYKSYFCIYYERLDLSKELIGKIAITRNGGFFSEPGLYSVYICFNLFLALFWKEKMKKIEVLIYIVVILSTVSTTGIIVALLMIGYYIVVGRDHLIRKKSIILGIVLVIIIFFIINELLLKKSVEHSFSFSARMYDLIGGIQLFIQKPLFGWGYRNADIFYEFQRTIFKALRGNSNGIATILYQLGIVGAGIYTVPIYYALKSVRNNIKAYRRLSFFIMIFIVLIMGEPIQYMPIMFSILAICLGNYNVSKKEGLKC